MGSQVHISRLRVPLRKTLPTTYACSLMKGAGRTILPPHGSGVGLDVRQLRVHRDDRVLGEGGDRRQPEDPEVEYLATEEPGLEKELEEGALDCGELDEDEEEDLDAVNTPPSLPSNLDLDVLRDRGLEHLIEQEIQLRKAHLNDTLERLRMVLGHRTALFVKVVRGGQTCTTNTRAWSEVNECTRERNMLAREYCRSRQALISLGVDGTELRSEYQPLLPEDLMVNKDMTEANRYNAKDTTLAWFWKLNKNADLMEGSVHMMECKHLCLPQKSSIANSATQFCG